MKREKYYTIAFFFTTILSLALCWVMIQEAQFYCENYCEAKGESLVRYHPGSCTCTDRYSKLTIDEIDENHTWPGIQ